MKVVAGVDAGGSTTVVSISPASTAEVLASHVGGPAPLRPSSIQQAATTIAATVDHAMDGLTGATLERMVVGAAGAGREETRNALEVALHEAVGCPVRVHTDAEIAHWAAFHGEVGTLLVVGTGAIALARDAIGGWHRVGGYGPAFADEIGGFNIGRSALAAVGQAQDGRGPMTLLTDHVMRLAGVESFEQLVAWASDAGYDDIASLAAVVTHAASEGDSAAGAILGAATGHLVAYADRAIELSGGSSAPIALAGGLMEEGSPLRDAVIAALRIHLPDATVLTDMIEPVRGALELAGSIR